MCARELVFAGGRAWCAAQREASRKKERPAQREAKRKKERPAKKRVGTPKKKRETPWRQWRVLHAAEALLRRTRRQRKGSQRALWAFSCARGDVIPRGGRHMSNFTKLTGGRALRLPPQSGFLDLEEIWTVMRGMLALTPGAEPPTRQGSSSQCDVESTTPVTHPSRSPRPTPLGSCVLVR